MRSRNSRTRSWYSLNNDAHLDKINSLSKDLFISARFIKDKKKIFRPKCVDCSIKIKAPTESMSPIVKEKMTAVLDEFSECDDPAHQKSPTVISPIKKPLTERDRSYFFNIDNSIRKNSFASFNENYLHKGTKSFLMDEDFEIPAQISIAKDQIFSMLSKPTGRSNANLSNLKINIANPNDNGYKPKIFKKSKNFNFKKEASRLLSKESNTSIFPVDNLTSFRAERDSAFSYMKTYLNNKKKTRNVPSSLGLIGTNLYQETTDSDYLLEKDKFRQKKENSIRQLRLKMDLSNL